MNKIPILPTIDGSAAERLFGDKEKAEKWWKQKKTRENAICDLIRNTIALQIADPNNKERFIIISPGIRGKKYSLSFFDERGAVSDLQRDDLKILSRVIPDYYILVDMIV